MSNLAAFPRFCTLCLIWLAAFGTAAADAVTVHVSLPKHRIQPNELAIIVNDSDPLSVRIAEYYIDARGIPADNLIHVDLQTDAVMLDADEFARLKSTVDSATAPHIQAYAITWVTPYRVECMSITSALAFGFDKSWCSSRQCATTRHSPYFGYTGTTPFQDLEMRPTMSIAATTFADARALIDRGIQADKTHPDGTAYLLSTKDKPRNVRAVFYARTSDVMQGWIDTRVILANDLQNRDDVLFYFTGRKKVSYLDTLGFRPGAIADHLTSAGGKLTSDIQMSALRWLEAGATGSFGTVVEPCNHPGKFPHPGAVMERYGSGRTLIEAYWQAVQQPGEGIFIGEPLAAPFDGTRYYVEDQQIVVHTRTLLPGNYRLHYSPGPVGPYKSLEGILPVSGYRKEFRLPLLGPGYYRLSPVE